MKVSQLIQALTNDFGPDDEVCVLMYDKKMFDFPEDDELTLTDEGWRSMVADFEQVDFPDIWESLSMAALDYAIESE